MGHCDSTLAGLCTYTGHTDSLDVVPEGHKCSTVSDVVAACLAALPGIDGAAVAVMTGPDARQTVHASDGVIAAVEDLQFLQGQGPCWDAFSTAAPVLVADLHQPLHWVRWPAYLPEVTALGVSAIFALPVGVPGNPLGVLDLYRTTAGPLQPGQVNVAGAYAAAAACALLNTAALTAEAGLGAAGHRDEVHQASGYVMVQLGVSCHEALLRLRAYAYGNARHLDDVCHDVVTRRLRFTAAA